MLAFASDDNLGLYHHEIFKVQIESPSRKRYFLLYCSLSLVETDTSQDDTLSRVAHSVLINTSATSAPGV